MISIRCSKIPLADSCAASQVEGLAVEADDDDPAALGRAVHYALAGRIASKGQQWPDEEAIRSRFNVDVDELGILVGSAWKCWQQLEPHFIGPKVEQDLKETFGGITLTGHIDVLSLSGGRGLILDWKTGRADADHAGQMKGYAWLVMNLFNVDSVYAATVLVRDQEIDPVQYTRQELAPWWEGFCERLAEKAYRPGVPQCLHCPRKLECPARQALITDAAANLDHMPTIGPHNAAKMLDRVRLLEDVCAQARSGIKIVVEDAGGKLATDDGRELYFREEKRRDVRVLQAMPILKNYLETPELMDVLQIGNEKLEKAVKAKAAPRQKGRAVAGLWADLQAAGAVETTFIDKLAIRKRSTGNVGTEHTEIAADDPRAQPWIEGVG